MQFPLISESQIAKLVKPVRFSREVRPPSTQGYLRASRPNKGIGIQSQGKSDFSLVEIECNEAYTSI